MAQCSFYSALSSQLPRIPSLSLYSSLKSDSDRPDLSKRAAVIRPGIETPITAAAAAGTKVFVVSDLHTDYPENMSWVKSLPRRTDDNDVLVVAGDVAETCANFVQTMSFLKDKFHHVFFVPGNHDLWLRREETPYLDSVDKLEKLLDECRKIGVITKPTIVGGLGIIPLYSWYHESFDAEKDITEFRIPSLGMVINFLSPCL
ncbi:hypothetical protein ACP275_03G034600 [Erythranthe tilingii]